jgi:dienelactone hydrolase
VKPRASSRLSTAVRPLSVDISQTHNTILTIDPPKVSTYITFPESKDTSTAIIILPDVIGHEFINAQLIADQFAANGYYVVMPDLFQGDPVKLNRPEDFDIMAWLQKGGPEGKGHLPDQVDPIVESTLSYMKEQGAKKIGAVGYCFGGKYVARFLAKGKGVDVGYTAHPSFVDEDEIKGMTGPLSIAAAGMSEPFSTT